MRNLQSTFLARRQTPGQRGLTLVEVLVAMVILALALLAYLTVIQVSDTALNDGNEYNVASQAIGNQVAQAQGLGYSGLTNGTTTTSVSGLSNGSMTVVIGALDANTANMGIKQVDITLTWTTRKYSKTAITSTLRETTLVSNR